MSAHLRDLYQQVILERYKKPRNKGRLDPADRQQRGHNPSCGDMIELTLQIDANQTITDVKFEGEGCAIAIASADLMADVLRGCSFTEALTLVQQFQGMLRGEVKFPREYRSLNVMQGVSRFPVRIKCANLAWHTLRYALEQPTTHDSFVSNEDDEERVSL